MAILEIPLNQRVRIPAIRLSNGQPFDGKVVASDGELLVLELAADCRGVMTGPAETAAVMTWSSDGIQRACPIMVESNNDRRLTCRAVIQEKRESPRLRVEVQVAYERVAAELVRETADEVMAKISTPAAAEAELGELLRGGQDDPLRKLRDEVGGLHDMLSEVLLKLDNLMTLIASGERAFVPGLRSPLCVLNCSSTGIGFLTDEELHEGEYLRIRMTLRTMPQTQIECMGTVIRCRPLNQGAIGEVPRYDVGVHYTHIHESDREKLIHYLFRAQRQMLRDRKEAREALRSGAEK
ncbi:MAG TPA: PilZ domain-containing protein [Candidatus Sumerlaeota bacterium]|nr:MAG: PilZ domain protein [candidate division BRC1 bacterium ADurb.BinA292]HPK01879.1 PilZ domain-containing protein [Candidatus Sumerlaeota bacterium]